MTENINVDFADAGVDFSASLLAAHRPSGAVTAANLGQVTEDSLATAFSELNRDVLKFCHTSGRWYEWNRRHWQKHEENRGVHLVRVFLRYETFGQKEYCKASRIKAIESLLRESPDHAVKFSHWDQDDFLLGTPSGVIDLRTGRLLPPDPALGISKCTAVAPKSGTPHAWLQFLQDATNGDGEMIRYLQQICGYSLTGSTSEQALFFVYGPGGNGKSVFINTVAGILADYSRASSMDTFTASKGDRHPTELAMLQGARLVTASETEEGRTWAEARIKQLTGSDPIPARFMRQDFFEFTPQFKLIIVGNHAPQLKNPDEAMRRRFNILPFTFKPSKPDRGLEKKLRAEWPQILNWMVEGCVDWQKNGLLRPSVVTDATSEYFEEQDVLGLWIKECCDVGSGYWEPSHVLFQRWTVYAEAQGEDPGNFKTFAAGLKRLGFRKGRNSAGQIWKEIRLRVN